MVAMVLAPRLTKDRARPRHRLSRGRRRVLGGEPRPSRAAHAFGNALVVGRLPGGVAVCYRRWACAGRVCADSTRRCFKAAAMPAATPSLLLSVDTLKTCVVVDTLTRSRHDSDRELRGQGLGNLVSGPVRRDGGRGHDGGDPRQHQRRRHNAPVRRPRRGLHLAGLAAGRPARRLVPVPALAGILRRGLAHVRPKKPPPFASPLDPARFRRQRRRHRRRRQHRPHRRRGHRHRLGRSPVPARPLARLRGAPQSSRRRRDLAPAPPARRARGPARAGRRLPSSASFRAASSSAPPINF